MLFTKKLLWCLSILLISDTECKAFASGNIFSKAGETLSQNVRSTQLPNATDTLKSNNTATTEVLPSLPTETSRTTTQGLPPLPTVTSETTTEVLPALPTAKTTTDVFSPLPTSTEKPRPHPTTHFPTPAAEVPSDEEESTNVGLLVLAIGLPILVVLCLVLGLLGFCYYRKTHNLSTTKAQTPKKPQTSTNVAFVPPQLKEKGTPEKPQTILKVAPVKPRRKLSRKISPKSPEKPAAAFKDPSDAVQFVMGPINEENDKADAKLSSLTTPGQADSAQQPPSDNKDNPFAPDHIGADKFSYKGPLVLKKYRDVDLHHELEDEPERKVLSSEHVTFDDRHTVFDMGSEVEVLHSNRSKASLKGLKTETTDDNDKSSKKES